MPVYLLHGFRWPRPAIRIHIILQNLDDAAAEWISSPLTSSTLLTSFRTLHPTIMAQLPHLQLIEQYDPLDESAAATSQPYAFVADRVEVCGLSRDVGEVMGKGVGAEAWGALVELRDRLAGGEKVGWWVVYCGDEERRWGGEGEDEEGVREEGGREVSWIFLLRCASVCLAGAGREQGEGGREGRASRAMADALGSV